MNSDALRWLDMHWSPRELPNNKWIVVSKSGVRATADRFDEVVTAKELQDLRLDEIVFCYVTFDAWQ